MSLRICIGVYRSACSARLTGCISVRASRGVMLRVVLAVLAVELCLGRICIVLRIVLLNGRLRYWRLRIVLRIVLILLLVGVLRLGSKGRLSRRGVGRIVCFLPLLSLPSSWRLILTVRSLARILGSRVLSLMASILTLLDIRVIGIVITLLAVLLLLLLVLSALVG